MAMMVRYAANRKKKQAAVFYGGDERVRVPLPPGWEELNPRALLKGAAEFERWCGLEPDERLAQLAPTGFTCLSGMQQP